MGRAVSSNRAGRGTETCVLPGFARRRARAPLAKWTRRAAAGWRRAGQRGGPRATPWPVAEAEVQQETGISVVVPVYKEEQNIRPFLARMEPVLEQLTSDSGSDYEILFCLDPSPDGTEAVIQEEIQRNPSIKVVVFSRRFGQPAATMAGIALCKGEACVVIDVDLQDPPEMIPLMYAKMQTGFDVVYAKRRSSTSETRMKRLISWVGYGVIN